MQRSQFTAVVLAVESDFNPCLPHPKCILPLANTPLLWFPLNSLQKAGFSEALVVVEERYSKEIRRAMQISPPLSIHINFVSVTSSKEGLGSAEALKLVQDHIKTNFIVLGSAFVSDFMLNNLLDLHRIKESTVTCLLSSSAVSSSSPGPKVSMKKEYQLNILEEGTSRYIFNADRKELNDTVPLDRNIFKKFRNVSLSSKLVDCGVYVMQRGVIELLNEIKGLRSIRTDLIPFLLEAQVSDSLECISPVVLKSLERSKELSLALSMSRSAEAHRLLHSANPISCYAYTLHNKQAAFIACCSYAGNYFEANKLIVKHISKFHNMSGGGAVVVGHALIGQDCLVDSTTTVNDKTQMKRSVIGKHCKIGSSCKIINSLLMDNVIIMDGCIMFVGSNLSKQYSLHRPVLSENLLQKLIKFADFKTDKAVNVIDIGCGTGLSTVSLMTHLPPHSHVLGLDSSHTQIQQAIQDHDCPNLKFIVHDVNNKDIPAANESVDMMICVQSAHWLRINFLFRQANIILKPGGCFAIAGYGVPFPQCPLHKNINKDLRQSVYNLHNYLTEQGYWAPERKVVDSQFEGLELPFEEKTYLRNDPSLYYYKDCSINSFFDYIQTWSGLRLMLEDDHNLPIWNRFKTDFLSHFPHNIDQAEIKVAFPWFLLMSRKEK